MRIILFSKKVSRLIFMFSLTIILKFPDTAHAQFDSTKSHYLSFNALAFTLAGEVGFYYEYWPKPSISYRISYGHRFWQPNVIKNGGSGSGIQYYPGKADAIRLGFKFHPFEYGTGESKPGYFLCQLNGFFFDSGKYTTREGSNGLNSIPRWVTKVERFMGGMTLGGGFTKIHKPTLCIDYFLAVGFCFGNKRTTDYSYGASNGNQYDYNHDRVETTNAAMPLLEVGICIGGIL